MKITYSFDLVFDVDALAVRRDPQYFMAAKQSVDELVQELHTFLEKHPLIEGCALAESKSE